MTKKTSGPVGLLQVQGGAAQEQTGCHGWGIQGFYQAYFVKKSLQDMLRDRIKLILNRALPVGCFNDGLPPRVVDKMADVNFN